MTDLREGRIQAYLDDEMPPAERKDFEKALKDDPELPAAVAAQEERRALVTHRLALLDEPIDVEVARSALASTLAAEGFQSALRSTSEAGLTVAQAPRVTRRRLRWLPTSLGRAAALVLVGAGAAAAAVPGSPIRDFVAGLATEETVPLLEDAAVASEAHRERSEIRMPVPETGLTVRLLTLPEPWEVRIRPAADPMVMVQASPGTSYTTNPGGMDVQTDGASVLVEIPETDPGVTVFANGTVILRSQGDAYWVLGSETTQRPSDLVIRSDQLSGR